MSPRETVAWLDLARRRELRERREALLVQRLAAHGDKRGLESQVREWERLM